ncbi:MAG: gliding motility-associated C-terminal domain-containing protein [Flavobacteriales bacterium]|nr:gliding motility-associated C-terminal domain-containing protein [Flavobacteriales bacterium]
MRIASLTLIASLFTVLGFGQTLIPANLISTPDTGFCPPATFDIHGLGGGGCEYSVDSIPYNFYTAGGTSVSMSDDQILGPFSLGFSFDYFCNSYTSFYICSNGWVGFSSGQTSTWVVNPVPSTAANRPKNCVMAPWRDWNPAVGSGPYITYQTQGTAPYRRKVITWSSVPMFSCTTTYGTFQVVLYETTNVIDNNLSVVPTCTGWGNGDGVEALHNSNGTDAEIVLSRNDNAFTASTESWRYSLPLLKWIYDGDTVGEGPSLEISPSNGVYPDECEYVYAILDSANGNIAIDSILLSPYCKIPIFTVEDVLCHGDTTGNIMVEDTNTSATYPMTFYWKNSAGDTIRSVIKNSQFDTLETVGVGTYFITIVDASGCYITSGSTTVDEPDLLVTYITNPTPVSCPGGLVCDASAQANVTGGVAGFFFQWSSGETTQIANQLCQDTNTVTVTDANGCLADTFVIIGVPDTIITTAYSDTMICITNPAALAAASIGGTPPFSYVWTENSLTGSVVSTGQFHTAFPDTTTQYFVYSVDANGCPGDTSEVLIKVRPPLTSIIDPVDTICPYDTIDITAEAFGGDSIYTYSWSSGNFGSVTTVSPDEPVWYYLTVSDACGSPSYKDSVFVQVGGYSSISSEIRVEDDSICVGENVYLIASGRGGFRGPAEYVFTWSEASMNGNPIQFVRPTSTKEYFVTISDLCLSEPGIAKKTIYVGEPYAPPFIASPAVSCTETDVTISFGNYMAGYDYSWNFGDGETYPNALTDSVIHRYEVPGCYDVTLSVVSDFGCFATRTEECLVKILESPFANFEHSPENPSSLSPLIKFTDRSKRAQSVAWYLNGDSLSLDSIFMHEFIDTGAYVVSLVAISKDGCIDTLEKTLINRLDQTLYIPGSFTPNGDGLNDVFRIVGEGIGLTYYEFKIFDRWGKEVFFSKNPDFGWDGKSSANGELVPSGAYPFTLRYSDKNGEIRKARGQVIVSSNGSYRGLR